MIHSLHKQSQTNQTTVRNSSFPSSKSASTGHQRPVSLHIGSKSVACISCISSTQFNINIYIYICNKSLTWLQPFPFSTWQQHPGHFVVNLVNHSKFACSSSYSATSRRIATRPNRCSILPRSRDPSLVARYSSAKPQNAVCGHVSIGPCLLFPSVNHASSLTILTRFVYRTHKTKIRIENIASVDSN